MITPELHSEWDISTERLQRTYVLASFPEAIRFMAACVDCIEAMDHHPVWTNRYRKVTVELQSHDVGRVTGRDYALARELDTVFARFQ
jgi:4a-hydroxytetrahydrobiopterin dehydratase